MTFAELAVKVRSLRDSLARGELSTYRGVFQKGVQRDARDAFTNATDPVTGVPWAPLLYRTGQTLVKTGMLRHRTMEATNNYVHLPNGLLIEQTQPDYGVFHQLGTSRIPQRRFLGASPKTIQEARRALCKDIIAVMKAA